MSKILKFVAWLAVTGAGVLAIVTIALHRGEQINAMWLTEMRRAEIGKLGGFVAYVAVISIIIILLGVAALIVVNALKASPWGTFTIAMTIPIALLMGLYLRRLRPGKVLESSILGFVLVMLAIWGGQWASQAHGVA